MDKKFDYLREVAGVFGVSPLTLEARGIEVDDADPARGTLRIGKGTKGEIRLPLVRLGGAWAVPSVALKKVLQGLGALPAVDETRDESPVLAPARRGRPRRVPVTGALK
jgi:hypothetical protein